MWHHAKPTLTVIVAAAIYLTLAIFTINYAFGVAPSLEWAQATFGRLAGVRVWSHSAHAAGLFVAALPAAVLLSLAERPRAIRLAAVTGALTTVAALVPSFLHPEVRHLLDATFYATAMIDSIKMVLILMLVTWLFTKLPSNYAMQRSARVVTPLAETASGAPEVRSATGAPTVHRR